MSYMPNSLLKIFKLLGITPDKIKGINNLALAIDSINEIRSCYAAIALCLHYIDI